MNNFGFRAEAINMNLKYQAGFLNHFSSESIDGALPTGKNSPQKPPLGLYAEQLSGTSFTAPRHENLRSWLYRIRPSVSQGEFQVSHEAKNWQSSTWINLQTPPNPMRWQPHSLTTDGITFLNGIQSILGNGSVDDRSGVSAHLFAFEKHMESTFFYNADGEILLVPQTGILEIQTEFGILEVAPTEIAVIPRGIKFQINPGSIGPCLGYFAENYGEPLRLPGLGPIGSNGLANPRDFLAPVAKYNDQEGHFKLVAKFQGLFWETQMNHHPLDVVAWHGNYYPYKYDLKKFNTIGSVSFDHPDPSIFTVLTSPSELSGSANLDFVIFPPRWMVANNTFRPPWFHRNVMSEFMGLIEGEYDARASGFLPGGFHLHNCMTPHGPDFESHKKASSQELTPTYLDKTMAFMFESRRAFHITDWAYQSSSREKNYVKNSWSQLPKLFKSNN